jgi:hypothetical protein
MGIRSCCAACSSGFRVLDSIAVPFSFKRNHSSALAARINPFGVNIMKQRMGALLAVCGLFPLAVTPLAHAGVIDAAQKAAANEQQAWSAWGGDIGVRWNRGLLGNIGVTVGTNTDGRLDKTDMRRHEWFALRESGGLEFAVRNGSLQHFSGGSLQMRGGYVLRLPDGSSLDLRDLTLRVRADNSNILDAISGDGKVWFYTDRVMFELADGKRTMAIRAADLRIAPAFAARIGHPEAAHWEVADFAMNTQVYVSGSDVTAGTCDPYPWPGVSVPDVPGAKYQADLFMQNFSVSPVGCQSCDGPGGANDGIIGWAPSSTLRNNVNNGTAQATVPGDPLGTSSALYTANVAWYQKFTEPAPPAFYEPYKNDQHPYLIWNLYRINADGSIEQIGRSGVKHAFLTTNGGCADSCHDPHALGRSCSDTYGTGNNDSPWDMGPRSEIVPATGIWGRCGSIWDTDCDGNDNGNNNDDWTQRMKVRESQVDASLHPGATYLVDSWYLAREDINIYNSMATITGTPAHSGSSWNFSGQSNYRLGAAIDRWVDPGSPSANAMNSELAVNEGHVKVAVKATDLGDGNWRYDYAVMNFDFARAVIQSQGAGNGPDPRVVSNNGFDSFSIPLPSSQQVLATKFSDGTVDTADAWTVSTDGDRLTWSAPEGVTLDWGTLYSFSVTVAAAPVESTSALHVAQAGTPASFDVATLVPMPVVDPDDVIFDDGFEAAP